MPAILLTVLLLLLLPASAAAQVYKCKGKSGETMYSEHPCDARAQPMKLRADPVAGNAPPAVPTDAPAAGAADGEPAGEQASDARSDSGASNNEMARNREAERACIASATASIYGSSNDRVGTLQQQMAMLQEQLASAENAERSKAVRARMDTFRNAISREHANANAQMTAARRSCAQQHRPGSIPGR